MSKNYRLSFLGCSSAIHILIRASCRAGPWGGLCTDFEYMNATDSRMNMSFEFSKDSTL